MTNRRSNKVHGFVKFPVNDSAYENTGEGGLAVYAVFKDSPKEKVCLEGFSTKFYGDCIQDEWVEKEKRKRTDRYLNKIERHALWLSEQYLKAAKIRKRTKKEKQDPCEGRIFGADKGNELVIEDCPCARIKLGANVWQKILHEETYLNSIESLPISGIIYLGSTGASLWHKRRGAMWTASKKDLTPEGFSLIDLLEKLYGQKAKFVTILDT